jgi:hypothetical protein
VIAERTPEIQWPEKLLEDTGTKLPAVASVSALMKFPKSERLSLT